MDGKYLANARDEMQRAKDEGIPSDEHVLRSLAALTEAHAELETRVTRIETGPQAPEPFTKPQDP